MDWATFIPILGRFIVLVGVPSILVLSIPFLLWKYMDMKSKQKGPQ